VTGAASLPGASGVATSVTRSSIALAPETLRSVPVAVEPSVYRIVAPLPIEIGAIEASPGSMVIAIAPSGLAAPKRKRIVLPAGIGAFVESPYEM
jgi:hypothetical protein